VSFGRTGEEVGAWVAEVPGSPLKMLVVLVVTVLVNGEIAET
jgi:hypothetical protein